MCFVTGSTAQSNPLVFGFKMGPSLNWASSGSTNASNNGVRLGFGAGLVVDYCFADNFAVSSGLNVRSQRFYYQFTDNRTIDGFLGEVPVSVDRRVKGTYFELPLEAKAGFEIMDSWKAYVEAGLGIGVNVSDYAKDSFTYQWVKYSDESYLDYSYQYRLLQASILFGLGVEYEFNHSLSLFAQLSLNHALSNTFTHPMENSTGSVLNVNCVALEIGILH